MRKLFLIAGLTSVTISVVIFSLNKLNLSISNNFESKNIETFFSKYYNIDNIKESKAKANSDSYVGVLEIPIINLKKGFYNIGTPNNDVEKGIEVLKKSIFPDNEQGNLIIASHSGTSKVSYFSQLNKLKLGDEIFIYYNGLKYRYILSSIYKVTKTGTININYDKDKTCLTMITCEKNTNKQIVYISYLIDNKKM